MMNAKNLFKLTAIASLMSVAGSLQAAALTNPMTNIVTVPAECDIVAIGIDFGSLLAPTVGIPLAVTPNITAGTTSHPDANKDGLSAPTEDNLTLGGLGVALPSALPGVFVLCNGTPSGVITLASSDLTKLSVTLSKATGASTAAFTGTMFGVGGGATATDTINYTMTLTGLVAATPVLFTGTYTAVGVIPGGQTPVSGFYTDVVTATVNF